MPTVQSTFMKAFQNDIDGTAPDWDFVASLDISRKFYILSIFRYWRGVYVRSGADAGTQFEGTNSGEVIKTVFSKKSSQNVIVLGRP